MSATNPAPKPPRLFDGLGVRCFRTVANIHLWCAEGQIGRIMRFAASERRRLNDMERRAIENRKRGIRYIKSKTTGDEIYLFFKSKKAALKKLNQFFNPPIEDVLPQAFLDAEDAALDEEDMWQ